MRRKRDIKTQELKKWKARLNFDGSQMQKGEPYDHLYAPVTLWSSIRLALTIATTNNWVSTQVDYVMAFPQAPSEREVYMEILRGYDNRILTWLTANPPGFRTQNTPARWV